MSRLLFINTILALVWMSITGHFTYVSFAFGFVLGMIGLWVIREQIGQVKYFRRIKAVIILFLVFIFEVLKSGFSVAKLLMSPKMEVKPALFSYPLELQEDWEITLLASLITLTPGTLSVDVSPDEKNLYVHVINTEDLDGERETIRTGFERLIKELTK